MAQGVERRVGRLTLLIRKTRCGAGHSQHHSLFVFSSTALVLKLDNRDGPSAATLALASSTSAATVTTARAPVGSYLEVLSGTRGSEADPRDTRAKEDIDIVREIARLRRMHLLLTRAIPQHLHSKSKQHKVSRRYSAYIKDTRAISITFICRLVGALSVSWQSKGQPSDAGSKIRCSR